MKICIIKEDVVQSIAIEGHEMGILRSVSDNLILLM